MVLEENYIDKREQEMEEREIRILQREDIDELLFDLLLKEIM